MIDKLGSGLSLLVPFRDDHEEGRADNWAWLRQYWEHALPGAEIVVGDMPGDPFSKTCAFNEAFRHSSGDVIVLLDADCYISANVVLECAAKIRQGRQDHEPVWFVPYSHLFRLTRVATLFLITSDPAEPLEFSEPPSADDVGPTSGSGFGHWFGALIQMMPREAFSLVHGMDARMRGWGGEDVANMLIVDTLFGIHRMSQNQVLTLWHTVQSKPGTNPDLLRTWSGQDNPRANWTLAGRYRKAHRDQEKTRAIIQEWLDDDSLSEHRIEEVHHRDDF